MLHYYLDQGQRNELFTENCVHKNFMENTHLLVFLVFLITPFRHRIQISLLVVSKFERINQLPSHPYFSYNFLIENFILKYTKWPNFITRLFITFMFHAEAFDDVIIFEYLKNWNLIITTTKRAFEVKEKTFFLVSEALTFSHTKHTTKNVADTTFKFALYYSHQTMSS